jgi:hypothetical protein
LNGYIEIISVGLGLQRQKSPQAAKKQSG